MAATGGLITTAFLQAAVAAADAGADAFTIGGFTFDPQLAAGGEGFDPVFQLTTTPPLLELGGGTALGLPLATQAFNVYDPTNGTELGSIQGNETVTELFGLTNAEFTVGSVDPTGSATDANLPTVGSVYDVFNLGNGYENVYVATPGADGTVTDTLITPFGNEDLNSLFTFNAADPLNPGDAFTGLEVGNISGAADAFSIAGYTLDPQLAAGGEGFDTIAPLATAAPFLEIGGSSLGDPVNSSLSSQAFEVLNSSGTEIGTINTGVDVTNLFGLTNTQLVVEQGSEVGQGLPTQGTVLDAMNFGHGYENVYTATPDVTTDGVTTPGTVTDTLVTPYGNINLDSLFGTVNYANPLDPGDAVTGLQAGDGAIGADAFTIGGVTFDPTLASGGEGFTPVEQLVGAPPFLDLGGGTPTIILGGTPIPLSLATQDFNIYDGSASTDQIGCIETTENVTNLLGLTNTEFTVTGGTLAADAPAGAAIPTDGSVYDVLNFGGGFENIYTAIPGVDGAAAQISDVLATPFGNVDLSDLFGGIDATALLNPGDAFTAGLEALTSAATDAGAGAATAIDPLSFLGL
ncbi:hypothetical protein [Mycobacterium paraterrae]|uniref:Uncharacterized protein n=1 Tax=Mycobacterium paraterrae TaxID=577492 RepID=A0ABY3VIZ3_9MYCO|nr:hypothetical protein [Mycobacterium paraterrae]UMB69372.1 hypothetical protein MKK62_23985 [Mycobacterium paraterrae]